MPESTELPLFQQYQYAFSRHIRDPRQHPRPRGVAPRRMNIYNALLYDNVESFLLTCFPVLRKVLGKRLWRTLVRAFFAEHRCHTPLFRRIPEEFLAYLHSGRTPYPDEPPFLIELAHYEWIELALSVADTPVAWETIDPAANLLTGQPALNPVLALLNYTYPVHRIGPRYKPADANQDATSILVFRNLEDEVRFIEMNRVSARLVALLQTARRTGREALAQIGAELRHPHPAQVIDGGREILENLRQQQAILGGWHG